MRPDRGGKAVAYAVALFLLLVLIQWPVGGYSPDDHLPSTSPDRNETTDTDPPAAPVLASAVLAGASNENVLVSWELSADDEAGDDDVSHYAIYLSGAYDYEGDGYSYLGQAGSGETSFTHSLAGDGDWLNHFYYVQANDTSGNGNWSGQAGKFVRFIEKGKHLASVPLVQEDTTLEVVLQTLAGSFKHVRYYKSSDQSDHWKTYWTFKTYGTLFDIDHKMGFWIDMTKDDHLVVAGLVPEMTQIELGHNWNLVSYPSFIDRTVSDALAGIDWVKVQGWGATPPYHQKQMSASDIMTAGEGYWIWVDLPQVWVVSNKPLDPPYIVDAHPPDGALNVPLNASIFIKFSKEMNTSSSIVIVNPDPGGYAYFWSEGNTLLEIRHTLWPEATVLTCEIQAEDLDGNSLVPGSVPNPWSFTTTFDYPQVLNIEPPPGAGVDPHQCLTISFSEPMDPSSVIVTIMPFVAIILTWNSNYTELTICPEPQWNECTIYIVTIMGNDMAGNPLLGHGPVPLPFQFMTTCYNPYIVETDPLNGSLDIPLTHPISVRFSEPMNTASVYWTVWPDPGGWDAAKWYENDTLMVLNHSNMFSPCTTYGVEVTSGVDKAGNPLIPGPVPNPWSFTAVSFCPYIISTDPYDNETNVSLTQDIVITFSAPMNASTLVWSITPDPDPGGWSDIWPGPDLLVLTHVNPFQSSTTYTLELIYIEGENGVPLCSLPVTVVFTTTW
ncbi:MAG: Ig-like domain-containing protein [Thermoplasmata archaeon]|nr:Ig-like domain-containing protein [Thermoplasmata archaeon]